MVTYSLGSWVGKANRGLEVLNGVDPAAFFMSERS